MTWVCVCVCVCVCARLGEGTIAAARANEELLDLCNRRRCQRLAE